MSGAEVIPLVPRARNSRRKPENEKSVLVMGRLFSPRMTSIFNALGDNTKAVERALAAGSTVIVRPL